MTPREFERAAPVAAARFCDLIRNKPATPIEAVAEQAWVEAEAFDAATAKRDPGEPDAKGKRLNKTTA